MKVTVDELKMREVKVIAPKICAKELDKSFRKSHQVKFFASVLTSIIVLVVF